MQESSSSQRLAAGPHGHFDVVVVGFGPAGAVLSGLLGRRGLRVAVLDRDHDVFGLPRAAHIDHTGLRTLQELGCLEACLPSMLPNPGLELVTAEGETLVRVPGNQGSVSGLPASMYFHQPGFDRALRAQVSSLPNVSVFLGHEVLSIDADARGATVTADGAGGRRLSLGAAWVVGCDGAASFTRESAGLELEDLGFEQDYLVVDLKVAGADGRLPRSAVSFCDPARPVTSIPMPGGRHRFEFQLLPGEDRDAIRSAEAIRALTRRWLPPEQVEPERSAIYTFHGLVARRWRSGRVLIAGDAAHQMPPFLGQGMCSGIRDAANLAWKLDAVIRGTSPDALLDTYEQERRPHVRQIVEAAIEFGRLICVTDAGEALARDRSLASRADRSNFKPFSLPSLARGPLVLAGGGGLFPQPAGASPGARLDDRVGQRFFVLARTERAVGPWGERWTAEVGALVWTLDRLDGQAAALRGWLDRRDADVVVVRPDRYVLGCETRLERITRVVEPYLMSRTREAMPDPRL